MNVKHLKKIIEFLPDSTLVVVPGSDHSYREADARQSISIYTEKANHLSEDFGEKLEKGDQRIAVLVVS